MSNIFKVKENKRLRERYKLSLETREWKQVNFGAKSLKASKTKGLE